VIALGNRFGLEGTLTVEVVSALERPIETDAGLILRGMIQTDAAINPANSGGPLFHRDGQVVGIHSMIVSPTGGNPGLGFAIPINAAARVVAETERVTRGWIDMDGIVLDPRSNRAAQTAVDKGTVATRVVPDGNAARRQRRAMALYRQCLR
jgi:S1-C subfamily serine protease